MVICQKCSAENEENNIFCLNCGEKLKTEINLCLKCGVVNPSRAKFCIECGMKLKTDSNSQLLEKNVNYDFSPEGSLDDFRNDIDMMQKFADETTKMVNITTIRLNKDENLETNLNNNLQEIQNKINLKENQLNTKLKVLNTDLIYMKFSKDKNDPQLIRFNISIDEGELMKYVEFYKNQNL
jgi:ribosomal protein L40E